MELSYKLYYKLICKRIGIFKEVLHDLPNYDFPLFYNAFVR